MGIIAEINEGILFGGKAQPVWHRLLVEGLGLRDPTLSPSKQNRRYSKPDVTLQWMEAWSQSQEAGSRAVETTPTVHTRHDLHELYSYASC